MKKIIIMLTCCIGFLFITSAYAEDYLSYPQNTYFYGNAKVVANLKNICVKSHGRFVFKTIVIQFGSTIPSFACDVNAGGYRYGSEFKVYFDIARNDGSGETVMSCQHKFIHPGRQLTKASPVVTLSSDGLTVKSCVVTLE